MLETFRWLFSSDNFMPHGHCFLWQPATLWLNVGSDGLIAASYLSIPAIIIYFLRHQRAEIRYAWVPTMFGAFILLCGATHIMEIWTVWTPMYRIAGALKLATGLVSFGTLASLIWILPRALLLKTPGQLHAEVDARTHELQEINAQLRAQIAARDVMERALHTAQRDHARSDAMLHAIVESAPSLIYAKDVEGRLLLANPPVLAVFGKSWADVQGRTERDFLDDPAQAEIIMQNDRRVISGNATELFEETVGHEGTDQRIWFSTKAPLRDSEGAVMGLVGVSVEITERKRLEHRLRLMVDELNHRVKNTLATVQAVAAQTLRGASPELYASFQARLLSLATAHDVLTRERWSGAELSDVVKGQLIPYEAQSGARIKVSGPTLRLSAKATLGLAMGLHELATNALKYGALSNDAGRVSIEWTLTRGIAPMLRLTWTESGGPPVRPPERRGFGSRLIERILLQDFGAAVELNFDDPTGVVCLLEAPVAQIAPQADTPTFPEIGAALGAAT